MRSRYAKRICQILFPKKLAKTNRTRKQRTSMAERIFSQKLLMVDLRRTSQICRISSSSKAADLKKPQRCCHLIAEKKKYSNSLNRPFGITIAARSTHRCHHFAASARRGSFI
ncbi:hypothetical protein ABFS83_10G134800 [Erythranthe nasuta]